MNLLALHFRMNYLYNEMICFYWKGRNEIWQCECKWNKSIQHGNVNESVKCSNKNKRTVVIENRQTSTSTKCDRIWQRTTHSVDVFFSFRVGASEIIFDVMRILKISTDAEMTYTGVTNLKFKYRCIVYRYPTSKLLTLIPSQY